MVRIQSEIKRGFLRVIKNSITASPDVPLLDALNAFQNSIADQSFKKGRVYVSTSGSGQSASFQIPSNLTQLNPETLFALSEELISIHDTVVTGGVSSSDTAALFAAMIADDRLAGIRQQMGDFTGLGIPASGRLA